MKNLILALLTGAILFTVGYVSGVTSQPTALANAKVRLVMQGSDGAQVTREYQSINSWAYNVVGGQPQMQLGFVNPTVYRCGFEP